MTWTARSLSIGNSAAPYLESGPPGSPDVIVLLHAFPLGMRMWEAQTIPGAWRAIAPAFPGFDGAAPASTESSRLDDYAASVSALLDGLRIERAVIGGVSRGGYVTLALWRLAPARFRALFIADSRAGADAPEARANRDGMIELVRSKGAAAVVEQMLPKLVGDTTRSRRPDVVAAVRRLAESQTVEGIAAAVARLRDRPDASGQLGDMRVPALVVVGDEDTLTPPAESERMARAMPSATLETIPGAGHLASLEDPPAFDAVLARFLSRLRS